MKNYAIGQLLLCALLGFALDLLVVRYIHKRDWRKLAFVLVVFAVCALYALHLYQTHPDL